MLAAVSGADGLGEFGFAGSPARRSAAAVRGAGLLGRSGYQPDPAAPYRDQTPLP